MKSSNPGILALYLSASLTLLSGFAYWLSALAGGTKIPWVSLVISGAILLALQFFLIRYFLQSFIYAKIKLIYKTIHSLKLSKEEKRDLFKVTRGNVLDKVNEEVADWASAHRKEMDALMQQETFRREFLANVSHELKTPLFNIQGFTLTLLEGGIHDPEINRDYLQKVEKNTERMITIVSDLEIISQLESGEAKPEMSRFDIVALTREVFEFLEAKAQARQINLILANENIPPQYVSADKDKIRQVLVNLIDNSIKYGREQGRTKVSFYNMDENLLIEVSDNGIGIEDVHLPHLFERFYRVDKHRSRVGGGSGLGLAIVKHIIEAHDQTINIRSAPGVGSTFSFTLKISR
ncbi:MAG TPA: ATP-binding protein [Bacteroidales bacterium]|nr:ATP-binding protein [Bacteroidales bacterium]HPT01009.1 ATP-binding protein [Bacteroidales bacterium]